MEYVMLTATTKSATTMKETVSVLQDVISLLLAMAPVTHSALTKPARWMKVIVTVQMTVYTLKSETEVVNPYVTMPIVDLIKGTVSVPQDVT